MSDAAVDTTLLRRALGAFVTGVTVVTTRNASGEPVGLTVNSFNAVSLTPPLLAGDQRGLSEIFARTGGNKFADIAWHSGPADMPLLDGVCASFTCRNTNRYPGGDHLIFIGEVLSFQQHGRSPLVYANGGYTALYDASDPAPAGVVTDDAITSG